MPCKCAQTFCGHYHSDVDGVCMSKGCICSPELLIPVEPNNPTYQNFAYHQKVMAEMSDIAQKVAWAKKAIDGTRNMDDWDFLVTMWKYAANFHPGDPFTPEVHEKIRKLGLIPENIRRASQKVCHEELQTLRMFQDLLRELEKEQRDGRPEYHKLTQQMKDFWMNSKYVPTDWGLLRKKLIKENAIFQWSIEELNNI